MISELVITNGMLAVEVLAVQGDGITQCIKTAVLVVLVVVVVEEMETAILD
tara:strand:- start:138 stop:290 length:153 start_codon:yes stop_codon:yes gene_type:complete